jgi:hypothetical protein
MSDNKNDKLDSLSKAKVLNNKKDDESVNKQYESALKETKPDKSSPKAKQASTASVLYNKNHQPMSPAERKVFLKQQELKRREQRLEKQRLAPRQERSQRLTRRDKHNHDNDDSFDDDASHDNHSEINTTNSDFGNNSGNQQQGDKDDNNDNHGDNVTRHRHNELHSNPQEAQNESGTQLGQNSQAHLEFLKDFIANVDTMDEVTSNVHKAMLKDVIGQMGNQFIVGMESFSKETKQHHVFGQGAHLCQKILIALKQNKMTEANTLIKKIIPKKHRT